jgi:hypothetical protein
VITEDHPGEAWAAAARSPQQVRVALCIGCDQLALGVHQIDCQNVRASDSPAALVPALSASQQIAANSDGWAMPGGESQPMFGQRGD